MLPISDPHRSRIQKKIEKLTARVFLTPVEERPYLLKRIEKLKQQLKDKDRIRQTVRIPADLFRHREKYVL